MMIKDLKNKLVGLQSQDSALMSEKTKTKILNLKFKLAKHKNEFELVSKTMLDSKSVVTAFVTFRSMEGADRCEKINSRLP